jgi:general secretion pathway protein I
MRTHLPQPCPHSCPAPGSPVCPPPQAKRGFTLVEVLVALTVVAITLAAGFRAAGVLSKGGERASDLVFAQWCAENYNTNLRLTKTYPDIGESEFRCEQLGRTYTGQVRIQATPNPNFRRMDVRILNASREPISNLITIVPRLY